MYREIDINKMNKSITFQNRGIGFTQLGIAKEILDLIDDLQQENKQLKNLYKKTCEHLFNIGNDELARYFQAQINECPTFTTQILGDKENE